MNKRFVGMCMLFFAFSIAFMSPVFAANGSIDVITTLPTFNVTLNGVEINNHANLYPLLVYKDITYFPLTYSDSRFFGLESNWKGIQEGLSIDSTDITAAYDPHQTEDNYDSGCLATMPSFPVMINGKLIDNSREEYPILLFRNITYFPITWRFAVDEFGWDYSFDFNNGLSIESNNIHLLQSSVPNDRAEDSEVMAIAGGYLYYVGANGWIMQSKILPVSTIEPFHSMNEATIGKAVYQLPFNSLGDGKSYVLPRLYSEDGEAYLSFYNGGATMGTDYLFHLNGDGATLINHSRNVNKSFGDKEFLWWVGSAPAAGNLYMKTSSTVNTADPTYPGWEKIGSPDYLYGWNWSIDDSVCIPGVSEGGSGSSDCYLIGDNLYILAFDTRAAAEYIKNGGSKPTTGLYQVNIKTNETKRISEQEVTGFTVDGDSIYYHNRYVELFRYQISEKKEYPLPTKLERGNNFIERFEVLGGQIYFESGVDHGLYHPAYETIGWSVRELKLTGSNQDYVACTLSGSPEFPDRIVLFDRTGKKVFRSSDESRALTVEGDYIYYFNQSTNTICIGDLK